VPRKYRDKNILAHVYFGVDLEIIWDLATKETPQLQRQIQAILEKESSFE